MVLIEQIPATISMERLSEPQNYTFKANQATVQQTLISAGLELTLSF